MARVYEREDSPRRYWLDYFDVSGRRIRKPHGNNRRAAEDELRRIVAQVKADRVAPERRAPRHNRWTVEDLRKKWLADWGRRTKRGQLKKSLDTDRSRWVLLEDLLGPHTRLTALTRERMAELAREVENAPLRPRGRSTKPPKGKRSAADVNRHRALLQAALSRAVEEGLLAMSPISGWKALGEPEHRDRTLTEEELDRLLNGRIEVRRGGPKGHSLAVKARALALLATGRTHAEVAEAVKVSPATVGRWVRSAAEGEGLGEDRTAEVDAHREAPEMRILIVLGYYCGLRLGEACGLRWPDVDLQGRMVRLERTKSGRRRDAGLDERAVVALTEWRAEHGGEWGDRVFSPTTTSANMSSRFTRLAAKLGLEDVRFHDLRHTAATNMSRGGAPWHVIKKQGGWRTDIAASRYVNPDGEDLLQAVDGAVGRSKRQG